jgi:molybdopterin molybdotransferase
MKSALPSYAEAASIVRTRAAELARGPASENVVLEEADGRVLAVSLHADRDQPPFPRSTRDGFACRAEEANTHKALPVAGSIHAGQPPAGPLPPHSAWEIMTGAAVPEGADAVAMIEHVARTFDSIRLQRPRVLEPGENIVPQGAEARAGDEVLAAGTRLGPQHIALAAACGHATITVFRPPKVAILATGDELVAIGATPGPGEIRNSNGVMLASLVARAGGEPWVLPSAADTARALDKALAEAIQADMVLVSGGVSAGKFDLVEPALLRLGARFHFTGVRIQPGKPLVFGEILRGKDSKPFLGLPGNPISSAATFRLFGSSILGAMTGDGLAGPRFTLALLGKDVKGRPDLTRFVPSHCDSTDAVGELPQVMAVPSQGSGDLASFSRANCFMVVPEGTDRLKAGTVVRILQI